MTGNHVLTRIIVVVVRLARVEAQDQAGSDAGLTEHVSVSVSAFVDSGMAPAGAPAVSDLGAVTDGLDCLCDHLTSQIVLSHGDPTPENWTI